MKHVSVILAVILMIVSSCETDVDVVVPEFTDGSALDGAYPIPDSIKTRLEGVYTVTKGKEQFGQQVVLKWNRNRLSIFGARKGVYMILDGGIKDSALLFEGKWRYAIGTETGLGRISIDSQSGARNLLRNLLSDGAFSLNGSVGNEYAWTSFPVTFRYKRPFSAKVRNKKFYIIAHRAGGRNSDHVGAAENSIEIVPYAEYFGANGIEIDVKLSKDNVPFIYHDTYINLRLTADSPLWGRIEDFNLEQLQSFVRLVNGEKIPTLKEMLEFVLEETNLEFVWLDMKSEKNAMPYVIPIQQEILKRAKQMGRTLEVMVGLPTDFARDNFLRHAGFENVQALCELNVNDVRRTRSRVWAPRWTLGTQLSLVREMHGEGRRVFTWTLDQINFISEFIEQSEFDGILTNYPTIVAYFHYAR
ncbi:MAG: glycerophosphodiester phosphodiesterase [Chlorobi bacterium]|nr:glycerophosphodiester phosphodiesterase [Chlorobiota bacterium]